MLTLSDINKLPDNVRQRFSKELPKSVKYEFWKINEISQACISGKYYELCYIVQDSSMNKNWIHTLVINSEGTVLKSCEYELNDNAWCCVRPSGTEPKIKFYFGVKGESLKDSETKLASLEAEVMKMFN